MQQKKFASHADLEEKKISFDKLSEHAYAYTAEGDPNTGIIVGDDAVMVIDTQATPVMAQDVIRRIREVTDKPIRYVVLSHYHAVRVLGASAYEPEHVIASRDTYDLIVERGEHDMKSEIERFPRLFRAVESVPGLTWPTLVFEKRMTLWLGTLQVELMQLGRGHTKGDTVAWLPQEKIMFSGDLVEFGATPYCGDAYLEDWPATLDAIAALVAAEARARPRRVAAWTPHDGEGGPRRHACVRHRDVRARQARRARRQGPAHRLSRDLRRAEAALRPLGHLRPLPAVRREPRVRRGHALSASAHLDGASATSRCGRRWKDMAQSRAAMLAMPSSILRYEYRRPPELDGTVRHCQTRRGGRRSGGVDGCASTSRSAACPCWCSTTTTRSASARARSATRSARSRSSTAWAAASRSRPRASAGSTARSIAEASSRTSSTSCPRPATTVPRS